MIPLQRVGPLRQAAVAGLLSLVTVFAGAARAAPPAPTWTDFLSRSEVAADAWSKAHPTWDGRGVVVAVLDTGIDPSVPGLDRLPDGSPKLIEARDFSGEGHVAVARAERDGDVLRQGKTSVRGALALSDKPLRPDEYWLGAFEESQIANGGVEDADGNGRSDDRFAVLAFRRAPDGAEVAVIDTDGDGDLADEKVRQAYAAAPAWFTLGSGKDPRANKAPMAFMVTPFLDEKRVELVFDDGSHGSHCAGIATGFGIEGKPGFDGIAPGARLMALKIGHNGLAGGATTKGSMGDAIRFASRWAKEHQTPVVMNISYGVGSDVEGAGDIQRVLDEELQKNRWLAASLSAGNEGPGLSSVGNPSATLFGWSAGALVPDGAWGTLFGAARGKNKKVFAFSSRGGELDKPDGLTPGVAWSTVPPYNPKSVMNGTSMASPQAAGVMALLISAALAEKKPWTPGMVKRAMRASAKPIAGYSSLEQGPGLVNVPAAWETLVRLGKIEHAAEVAGWHVSTPVPGRPGTRAPVSYWRVGGYAPDPNERLTFKVEPRFYGDVDEATAARHFDNFELASDVAWLRLDRGAVALRGRQSADVQVGLDRAALTRSARSGHHVGRVRAKLGGVTMFELPVVVVVPESFRSDWARTFEGRLEPGDVAHVFVEVPPGATGLRASAIIPKGGFGNVWLVPFDPGGHHYEIWEHHASSQEGLAADLVISGDDLAPGTWELTLLAPLTNRGTSSFELDVSFVALKAPETLAVSTGSDGATSASLDLVNGSERPFRGAFVATVDAYQRKKTESSKKERMAISFAIAPGVRGVDFELEIDGKTWDRMTDVAANILGGGGNTQQQDAFGQRKVRIAFDGAPGSYTLELLAAFTDRDDAREWKVQVTERHRLERPVAMQVDGPGGTAAPTLFPGVKTEVGLSAQGLAQVPDEFAYRALVTLTSRDGTTWARLALPFERNK